MTDRAPNPPALQFRSATPPNAAPDLTPNPSDEAATARTIGRMTRLVLEAAADPVIQAAAELATAGRATAEGMAEAIHGWVRQRVRYEDDETTATLEGLDPNEEVLIPPAELLASEDPAGDCDDFSMLTAALLLAVGIPASFKTIAADAANPTQYSHVYVLADTPSGPLALDTSHGPRPGWEAPPVGRSRVWRIPAMTPHAAQLGAIDWNQVVQAGVQAGTQIATARYAQPPVGTYQQKADGSVFYRQPENASALQFPGVQVGGSGGTLLLVAGVALVLLVVALNAGGGRR